MKYEKLAPLLLILFLPSCGIKKFFQPCSGGSYSNVDINDAAERHEERLRQHFTYGNTGVDVSTLIAETRRISAQLKYSGNISAANRFDSYTDVLMFGNRTIDESLNDVMRLVHGGSNAIGGGIGGSGRNGGGWCESVSSALDKVFGW
jgi:hypothetical protein